MKSDREKRVVQFKREKVLELFLKRGKFWEEIQNLRRKWGINAKVAVPSGRWSRMPPGFEEASPWESFAARWDDEIGGLIRRVVPLEFPQQLKHAWHEFFDACVLYDPPEVHLLEFADVGGPQPMDVKHPAPVKWPPENSEEMAALLSGGKLKMVAPPVAKLIDPDEATRTERWLARTLLNRVNERHLKPQGIDLWALVTEVWAGSDDLREEYERRLRENVPKLYIDVDEETTANDADNARRLIQQALGKSPTGGRPQIDELVALQCAILYDDYNSVDPVDRRVKTLTYKKLANRYREYGVKNERSAEEHVRLGRDLRETRSEG